MGQRPGAARLEQNKGQNQPARKVKVRLKSMKASVGGAVSEFGRV
jgi:hypothetical protein